MPDQPTLPSLSILSDQVASERETMNSHAESLDAKAGVVLGFAGVLVALGATAQSTVSESVIFQCGLGVAAAAAVLAAWAFLPRRYPVLGHQWVRQPGRPVRGHEDRQILARASGEA
jgi:3-mercaptopyruvate sulfurtransferase SseA